MKNFVAVLVLILGCFSFSIETRAQTYDEIFEEFDARILTIDEKRFLQSALAFRGYYNGLIDGKWGWGSQRALERYTAEKYSSEPASIHMAALVFDYIEDVEAEGWESNFFPYINVSMAFPFKSMMERETESELTHWTHRSSNFDLYVTRAGYVAMGKWHDWVEERIDHSGDIYELREQDRWVTSGRAANGLSFYIRSDYTQGGWSIVIIRSGDEERNLLNGVATSISLGRTRDLYFPENGELERLVSLTVEWLEEQNENEAPEDAQSELAPTDTEEVTSGTGFFIDDEGRVLTNAHVVEGCGSILVSGIPANLLASDESFDLAVVQSVDTVNSDYAKFAPRPAELNSDITVAGYPLSGLLGGLNVTRGAITSLKGLGGDYTTMQISAPVQSGNSGGPALDESGRVVGVVVSKLNALALADISGEIPQNVNFSVRGEIAKIFLASNGIDYDIDSREHSIKSTELAKQASRYTVRIECNL